MIVRVVLELINVDDGDDGVSCVSACVWGRNENIKKPNMNSSSLFDFFVCVCVFIIFIIYIIPEPSRKYQHINNKNKISNIYEEHIIIREPTQHHSPLWTLLRPYHESVIPIVREEQEVHLPHPPPPPPPRHPYS